MFVLFCFYAEEKLSNEIGRDACVQLCVRGSRWELHAIERFGTERNFVPFRRLRVMTILRQSSMVLMEVEVMTIMVVTVAVACHLAVQVLLMRTAQ